MSLVAIQIFLINIVIIHINETITLTLSFQLVISLLNLIFKISFHPFYNTRKTNNHFTTAFHFLNDFCNCTDLAYGICAISQIFSSSMYYDSIKYFSNNWFKKGCNISVVAPAWSLTLTKLLFLDKKFWPLISEHWVPNNYYFIFSLNLLLNGMIFTLIVFWFGLIVLMVWF